ncbi:hypothetical protein Ciccas_003057 [Cichlidogyrus casuarinus]|uniref:Uncharacterized protein n=1 Tax=Cichlidogyrus casuarinus TaxID=1844966 RepID=A0ABD2QIP6_9PLAT
MQIKLDEGSDWKFSLAFTSNHKKLHYIVFHTANAIELFNSTSCPYLERSSCLLMDLPTKKWLLLYIDANFIRDKFRVELSSIEALRIFSCCDLTKVYLSQDVEHFNEKLETFILNSSAITEMENQLNDDNDDKSAEWDEHDSSEDIIDEKVSQLEETHSGLLTLISFSDEETLQKFEPKSSTSALRQNITNRIGSQNELLSVMLTSYDKRDMVQARNESESEEDATDVIFPVTDSPEGSLIDEDSLMLSEEGNEPEEVEAKPEFANSNLNLLKLVHDPIFNCYHDPTTGKYYLLRQ